MKKIIIYIIVLLIALAIPAARTDISNLEPVEAIWINKNNGEYIVKTDTGDTGVGETVQQAVEMMKKHCEKLIYLDTAQYLLVNENCRESISDVSQYLKGKVKVCIWNGVGELKNAAQYVQTHRIGIKLKDYVSNIKLPEIPALKQE